MKKLLLILIALAYEITSYSCNLCVGHVGRRLRKHAPVVLNAHEDPTKACHCDCQRQPKSKHEDSGYKCLKCGHRLLPQDPQKGDIIFSHEATEYINAWKQNKLQRYQEQSQD